MSARKKARAKMIGTDRTDVATSPSGLASRVMKAVRADYREFAFRATGKDTDVGNLTPIDLYDNLAEELSRLRALTELLSTNNGDADPDVLNDLALLLRDIHDRMRAVLESMRLSE